MRKELTGVIVLFFIVFTLASLLSYSPADPSIFHAMGRVTRVNNFFGIFGAALAGFLVGLFGLGSFWVPALMLIDLSRFLGRSPRRNIPTILFGSTLLLISTSSILSFSGRFFWIFGRQYRAGGGIGMAMKDFLTAYLNNTGCAVTLAMLFTTGLILGIGFSPLRFYKWLVMVISTAYRRAEAFYSIWKARKEKRKKLPLTKVSARKKKDLEIKIKQSLTEPPKVVPIPRQEEFTFMKGRSSFRLPSINYLNDPGPRPGSVDDENLLMQSKMVEKKLEDFNVHGKVVAVSPGPVITTFEYKPAPGVKINKVVGLTDDLALALRAISIRIVAPIPGKAAIGIEIPNATREIVHFKEIVATEQFNNSKSKLTLCLGKDIVGNPVTAELEHMPHLLIAGATGAGKSVALNSMITSLLFKATPDEVKMIMIDPKRIELSGYDGIPHLITPVVTDMKKATNALFWAVREMERRYGLLSEMKSRNISQYNKKAKTRNKDGREEELLEELPYIVVIIDELADLMMVSSRDVEVALTRLAQMARAAGIHLVLATQRPSVDVLTGIIKANFPTRISFQVSSKTDSRTIIDCNGAENLLGNGDMLYLPPGTAKLQRIHGAYISEEEISMVIDFLKKQKPPEYDETVTEAQVKDEGHGDESEGYDERYDEAVALVTKTGQASISMVQRHLRIGYNRAARIIEVMEREGLVGPSDGAKPRKVLARGYDEI